MTGQTAGQTRSPTATPAGSPVALLDAIVRDALDPSYAQAAARHKAEDRIRGTSGRRISLVGVGLLLAVGGIAGITIASEQQVLPQVGAARSALAGNAGESSKQVDSLEQTLQAREREISALQQQQLQTTTTGRELQRQAAALNAAAGETPVSGPGIEVSVSDVGAAQTPSGAGNRPEGGAANAGITTDHDLQDVVNALWADGAEAISVGGIRLGPQTSIRTAGQSILVGFQALHSPYAIQAIGGPALLVATRQSPALTALAPHTPGVHPRLVVSASKSLDLPAAAAAQLGVGHVLTGGHS